MAASDDDISRKAGILLFGGGTLFSAGLFAVWVLIDRHPDPLYQGDYERGVLRHSREPALQQQLNADALRADKMWERPAVPALKPLPAPAPAPAPSTQPGS